MPRPFCTAPRRLGDYLGSVDPAGNAQSLKTLTGTLAQKQPGGRAASFEEFRYCLESEAFGIVITAHPTFNLPIRLMTLLAELATDRDLSGKDLNEEALSARLATVEITRLQPDHMTLEREHDLSQEVLGNLHQALRTLYRAALDVAGFDVSDLGVNVKEEASVAAIRERAPRAVGMSALLTTTAPI